MNPGSGDLPLEDLLAQSTWLRRLAGTLVAGEGAEDLVQATWLAALRHRPDAHGDPRAWLARVARNLASNFKRGEARRRAHEALASEREVELDPARLAEAVDAQRVLAEAVLRLEEPLRSTVVLRYFRGLDSTAIAREHGVPSGTVRWRLKRGLELLRADLDQRFGERTRWCGAFATLLPALPQATGTPALAKGITLMSTTTKLAWSAVLLAALGVATWWWIEGSSGARAELAANARGPDQGLSNSAPSSTDSPVRIDDPVPGRSALANASSARELATRECCVVGRVLDGAGNGIPSARVTARGAIFRETTLLSNLRGEEVALETISGSDGSYELSLPAHRPFVLTAAHAEFAPVASEPIFAGDRRDLVLLGGTTLTVHVTRPGGHSAARARLRVTFASPDSRDDTLWSSEGTTDEEGAATFTCLPAGRGQVEGDLESWHGLRAFPTNGGGSVLLDLELLDTGWIEGFVVERGSGAPIAGARVGSDQDVAHSVLTDSAGRFRLGGVTYGGGLWCLSAHATGFASGYQMVYLQADQEPRVRRFELERAVCARGRVVDEARRPLAGMRVRFIAQLALPPMTGTLDQHEARTDARGNFELTELVPGATYRGLVCDAGNLRGTLLCGPLQASSEPLDLGELVMARAGAISGEVADAGAETAYLVRIHCIGAGPWEGGDSLAHLATTRPDSHGRFAFDALAPGRYRLLLFTREPGRELVADLLAETELDLAPGEVRKDLRLDPQAACVTGVVVDADGKPLRAGLLRLSALTAPGTTLVTGHTNASGRFRLYTSAPGPFRLEVDDLLLANAAAALEPVVVGGAELQIRLQADSSTLVIKGHLTREDRAPVGNVFVRFIDTRTKLAIPYVAIPEPDGSFVSKPLPDVPYDLEVLDFAGRYEPLTRPNVRPGGDDVELELTPRP